jgi:hypothetical protein
MTANQRRTEPVPPTPAHDAPGADRADSGTGTSTGPGPREGALPAVARDGLADGETDNRMPPTSTF